MNIEQLCQWFLEAETEEDLPDPPFLLHKGVTLLNEKAYNFIKSEVLATLNYLKGESKRKPVCFDSGALERNLTALHQISDNW